MDKDDKKNPIRNFPGISITAHSDNAPQTTELKKNHIEVNCKPDANVTVNLFNNAVTNNWSMLTNWHKTNRDTPEDVKLKGKTAPEAKPTPEVSAAPEASVSPEVSAAPEATAAPEASAAPTTSSESKPSNITINIFNNLIVKTETSDIIRQTPRDPEYHYDETIPETFKDMYEMKGKSSTRLVSEFAKDVPIKEGSRPKIFFSKNLWYGGRYDNSGIFVQGNVTDSVLDSAYRHREQISELHAKIRETELKLQEKQDLLDTLAPMKKFKTIHEKTDSGPVTRTELVDSTDSEGVNSVKSSMPDLGSWFNSEDESNDENWDRDHRYTTTPKGKGRELGLARVNFDNMGRMEEVEDEIMGRTIKKSFTKRKRFDDDTYEMDGDLASFKKTKIGQSLLKKNKKNDSDDEGKGSGFSGSSSMSGSDTTGGSNSVAGPSNFRIWLNDFLFILYSSIVSILESINEIFTLM